MFLIFYMVNQADFERMAETRRMITSPAEKERTDTAQVESERQARLLRVIEEIRKVIRLATRRLNLEACEVALTNLKFREDGLMLPNVNSCVTGVRWLEALGKLDGQIIELVRQGAIIPPEYLASDLLVRSLEDHDIVLGKEVRGVDLRGKK